MPKFHELQVAGGDRGSLLRYAATARLNDAPLGTYSKRGAPKLPPAFLKDHRFIGQRQFVQHLYSDSLLDPVGLRIVEAVDDATPEEPSLAELRRGFVAARRPAEVASDVSGGFWPVLRTMPISRHPVDAVIGACSAINYLQHHPLTHRDRRGVQRLQRVLCRIAVGGYNLSYRAVDLVAVLTRWDADTPMRDVREGHRRIARALDRGIRTYVHSTAWGSGVVAQEQFDLFFLSVAGGIPAMMQAHHTPASSSGAVLRLARCIVRYHNPDNPTERDFAVQAAQNMVALARYGARDNADDVLLRREALLYLLEMGRHLAHNRDKGLPSLQTLLDRIAREDKKGDFADILAFSAIRGLASDDLVGDGGVREPCEDYLRPDQLTFDAVVDRDISSSTWPYESSSFGPILQRYLSPSGRLLPAEWHNMTRQIALPTLNILTEVLAFPGSGRVRTLADTLRHSGSTVRECVTSLLTLMLKDDDILACPIMARRAAWAIGFAGKFSADAASTLARVACNHETDYAIAADAAWALGDFIPGAAVAGAEDAMEALRRFIANTFIDLTANQDKSVAQRLIITQACLHSLALQRRPENAPVFARFIDDSEDKDLPGGSTHLKRARFLAQWGIDLIDSPPALALVHAE